jgi:hypothetical protein
MSDIFISYARADRAKAQLLANALEKQGWTVWWDRELLPGSSFERVIQSEIDSAKCIIVLWSRNAILSDWVKGEADEGRERGILIPALLDNSRLPISLRQIQTSNLSTWSGNDDDETFRGLVRAISVLVGIRTKATQSEREQIKTELLSTNTKTSKFKLKWSITILIFVLILLTLGAQRSTIAAFLASAFNQPQAPLSPAPTRIVAAPSGPAPTPQPQLPPTAVLTAVPTPPPRATPTSPPTAPPTPRPAEPTASPTAQPAAFWTVCVWCDQGSFDPKSEAENVAAQLRAQGLPAAILWSSDYPSLNAGYWVTYSGMFDSERAATEHLNKVRAAGFLGRVRQVSTKPSS